MKHITEASDDEIRKTLSYYATGGSLKKFRAAFDFSPSPLPAEGVAELTAKAFDIRQGIYDVPVVKLGDALAALSAAQSPTPSKRRQATVEDVGLPFKCESMGKKITGITASFVTTPRKDYAPDVKMIDTLNRQWPITNLFVKASPTPSDEELLRAYHGDDEHAFLARSYNHIMGLRAVAALTTTEGQN